MWVSKHGTGICNVCQKNFTISSDEPSNCFVCGQLVCYQCQQLRKGIPLPDDCPHFEREYFTSQKHVPVCLNCIKNPDVFFIKDKPNNLIESVERVFDLCVDAINLANKVFPISPSKQSYYDDYNPILHKTGKERRVHFLFSQGSLDLLRKRYKITKNKLQAVEDMLSEALKISIANCNEMSLFCFMYLFYAQNRREIFTTEFALFNSLTEDHVFLIISPMGGKLPSDKHPFIVG